ncbi:Hypothetical predicted protein [Paramuricea clavata]|uniref:Uncharacterized protein n=1 Tax=Paramuricea clavata TaxID=317549 RepID=A0A6S7JAB5_PARCT|nr:Hypothetical predicted protein [Paramuricea clavata]
MHCDHIENETRITQAPIVIIKEKINPLPLLGRATLEELGMVKIDEIGRLKEPNKPYSTRNIRKLQETQSSVDELLNHIKIYFMELAERPAMERRFSYIYQWMKTLNQLHENQDEIAYHLMEPL